MASADDLDRWSSALRRVVASLERIAGERAVRARRARVDWSGHTRTRFDAERARRDAELAALASQCRRLAVDYARLADEVRAASGRVVPAERRAG